MDECISSRNEWLQTLEINGVSIPFKLDTGADVNVIPQEYIANWPSVSVSPSTVHITTYTGQSIPVKGTCLLSCSFKGQVFSLQFVIVNVDAKPILGAKACLQLGLIQRIHSVSETQDEVHENARNIINKYNAVFTGRGRLPGTYHITLRSDANPVIVPAGKVPIAVEPLLKKELQRLQDDGIIVPVTQPTKCVNALVIVFRKDGRLRLCLDPRPLNKAIQRQHYHLPTQDELQNKSFDKISPRLQRLLLRHQRYDFKLIYIPGKSLVLADALSRAPTAPPGDTSPLPQEESIPECLLVQIADSRLQRLQAATRDDHSLRSVQQYIAPGWPASSQQLSPDTAKYLHCAAELHIKDGLICRGTRIVIPQGERQEILKQLHIAHRGLTSTQQYACETVYWPGISKDIQLMIATCDICQRNRNHPPKEPPIDRSLPTRPWQFVSADFFHLESTTYLIIADAFSKFIEVVPTSSTTSMSPINVCKPIFARYGYPEELRTDDGPPFDSAVFLAFLNRHAVRHVSSSPLYPRSNGFIERSVQTIKKSLIKARMSGTDLSDVLLDYRTTPLANGLSPAELLMGRRIRSSVPLHPSLLEPRYDTSHAKNTLKYDQVRQHYSASQHTHPLPPLEINQPIWYWTGREWNSAIVHSRTDTPRSYLITTISGTQLRRNRIHLRPRISEETRTLSSSPNIQRRNDDAYEDEVLIPEQTQRLNQDSSLPSETPHISPSPQQAHPAVNTSRFGRLIKPPTRFPDN